MLGFEAYTSQPKIKGHLISINTGIADKKHPPLPLKSQKAELFFNDGADIGEIYVNSNLKITRKTAVENVKINIKLPFFNLNFDASHVDNFEKSQIMISKIRALSVDLSGCHIGELICESGKLQECHVDSLVCKNDIAIGEDCVIKKIVKI